MHNLGGHRVPAAGDTKRTVAEAQRRPSGQATAGGPETLSAAASQTRGGSSDVSLANTLAWHLIPGVAGAVVFFALGPPLRSVGIPPVGALLVAGLFVLLPVQLGYLLYQGRRLTGRPTLEGAVHYRQPVPRRTYWTLIPALVIWALVMGGPSLSLKGSLFAWLPSWADDLFGVKDPGRYSQTTLLVFWALSLPVAGIAVPLVEELYFRGHLLPRLERLGIWAPVVNAVLFALYHLWSPWLFVGRVLGVLPFAYAVWRRRSIYIGIAVHLAVDLIGLLLVLPKILT
jgi:membrane protease YdiL (CAAX protease family)